MAQTKETLFLIEQGRPGTAETQWTPWEVAYLLDDARPYVRALREKSPLPIRIRRVDIVRTSEVLAEWDHGEPVEATP